MLGGHLTRSSSDPIINNTSNGAEGEFPARKLYITSDSRGICTDNNYIYTMVLLIQTITFEKLNTNNSKGFVYFVGDIN